MLTTTKIPTDLKKYRDNHSDINWSKKPKLSKPTKSKKNVKSK